MSDKYAVGSWILLENKLGVCMGKIISKEEAESYKIGGDKVKVPEGSIPVKFTICVSSCLEILTPEEIDVMQEKIKSRSDYEEIIDRFKQRLKEEGRELSDIYK